MTLTPHAPLPSPPLLRLCLAPRAGGPRAIDGAWWPRSYDLLAELPGLLAGLPRTWGHITSVVLDGSVWSPTPGRMFVAGQVVRLRRSLTATAAHTVVLLAPGRGALGPARRPAGHDRGGREADHGECDGSKERRGVGASHGDLASAVLRAAGPAKPTRAVAIRERPTRRHRVILGRVGGVARWAPARPA
ncbi:DUF5994 family protein [Streptomyces sp. PmtG]